MLIVPVAVTVFSSAFCAWQLFKVHQWELERDLLHENVSKYVRMVTTGGSLYTGQYPIAAQSPHERPVFRDNIRLLAAANRVTVLQWNDILAIENQQNMADPSEPPKKRPVGLYDPIVNELVIRGEYRSVLQFFHEIQQMPRLVNMHQAQLVHKRSGKKDTATASFAMSRYVASYMIAPDEAPMDQFILKGNRVTGQKPSFSIAKRPNSSIFSQHKQPI